MSLKIKTKLPLDLGKMHFIGIGGIGMSGIAEIIYNLGYKVSGSDLKYSPIVNRLIKLGIDVRIGHDPKNINTAEIIVYDDQGKLVGTNRWNLATGVKATYIIYKN